MSMPTLGLSYTMLIHSAHLNPLGLRILNIHDALVCSAPGHNMPMPTLDLSYTGTKYTVRVHTLNPSALRINVTMSQCF